MQLEELEEVSRGSPQKTFARSALASDFLGPEASQDYEAGQLRDQNNFVTAVYSCREKEVSASMKQDKFLVRGSELLLTDSKRIEKKKQCVSIYLV